MQLSCYRARKGIGSVKSILKSEPDDVLGGIAVHLFSHSHLRVNYNLPQRLVEKKKKFQQRKIAEIGSQSSNALVFIGKIEKNF